MAEEVPVTNRPLEVSGFKAYSSILQSISRDAVPAASKNFRKPDNVPKKGKVDNRPDHQLSKLERVQKYLAKAQKAEIAKKKNKKQQQQQQQQKKAKPVTTISLDSSSCCSEDDDVIEIPVPPPPLVCLDDSSDDSMQAPATNVPLPKSTTVVRTSRCSSPSSSIISDDFIAPLDRNCLSDSLDSVNMTEEDLRAAGKARASVAQTLNKKRGEATKSTVAAATTTTTTASSVTCHSQANSSSSSNSKTVRPRIPLLYKNLIASQKDVTIAHYHEDAANSDDVVLVVPATDENENNNAGKVIDVVPTSVPVASSDPKKNRRRNLSTGDSVYAKGSGKRQRTAKPVPESSDSEVEDAPPAAVTVAVEKTLTKANPPKPTASTSNKPKIAKRKSRTEEEAAKSSCSESESVGVSYIRSGEAVSHAQTGEPKKRPRRNTATVTPPVSDNVFISMLSTIAQGGEVSDSDSVEMLPSTIEEVTICSSEDTAPEGCDRQRARKTSAISFNEFPHESILKLVPIERRDEWAISDADRIGPLPTPRVKCTNCWEMGHVRSRCKRPYKAPSCYMCGETGHREPRCPNAICLLVSLCRSILLIRCCLTGVPLPFSVRQSDTDVSHPLH